MDVLSSAVSGGSRPLGELISYALGTVVLILVLHAVFGLVRMLVVRQRHLAAIKDYTGPKGHWLMGNVAEWLPDGGQLERQRQIVMDHQPVKSVMGPYALLTLNDPQSIKVLCNSSAPKDDIAYKFLKPYIGDSLPVISGHKWQLHRNLLTPAFNRNMLKNNLATFSKSANVLMGKWNKLSKQENSLEMFGHIKKMTMDNLMKCCFSQYELEGTNLYVESSEKVIELVFLRASQPLHHSDLVYYLSWNGYKFRQAVNRARSFPRAVVQKRRLSIIEDQQESRTQKKQLDLLDILLSARNVVDEQDEEGTGLTEQEIQNEVDNFMLTGSGTTTSGITWCLYHLAAHPEYQQKCREEVERVLGDRDTVCWEDLAKLEYLTMCLKESMRILPPAPAIGRTLDEPLQMPDGKLIPAGLWVMVGIYQLHHNPRVWPDPEVYDPERFNEENSKHRHSHAFLPFSSGPRNCIGQHFSLCQMKVTLALILKTFQLEYTREEPPDTTVDIVIGSKSGVWLKITPIS